MTRSRPVRSPYRVLPILAAALVLAGCGVTVKIDGQGHVDTPSAALSRDGNPKPQRIRWRNLGSVDRTVQFYPPSPFPAAPSVAVPAGQTTAWYVLPSTGIDKKYPYKVIPPPDSLPPGEPDMDVGP